MKKSIIPGFILSLLFIFGTVAAQSCPPVPLVNWPIDTCILSSQTNIYSEFQPNYPNTGGCVTPSASTIYRNSGTHSCNLGPVGGDGFAFCVGGFSGSSYYANHPAAIRFTVSFGVGDTGSIGGFTFMQSAADPALFLNGNSQNNNYPTLYGLRVLKDSVEIFRQTGLPTDTVWNLESFNFSSLPDFSFTGPVEFEFELYAYSPVGNGFGGYIWDLDDFSITGCCTNFCDNVTNGGTIGVAQSGCGSLNPALIQNLASPTGGSGGLQYIWLRNTAPSNTGATVINFANGPTYDPPMITQTTYYRRAARRIGCADYVGESNWVEMTVHPQPSLTCNGVDVTCGGGNDGVVWVNVSGGTPPFTYAWTSGDSTNTAAGLTAGTYLVDVLDSNNCFATCGTTISEPTPLVVNLTGTPASCNPGGDATASASVSGGNPPYSYLWSNGNTTTSVSGLSVGTYTFTVTDAINCSRTDSITILASTQVTVSTSGTDPLCNGDQNGSALATASGGTAPYTYLWNNGQTAQSLSGLAAGTYTVTVTDSTGCSGNGSLALVDPAALSVTLTSTDITCNRDADGTADVQVSGGTPPYSYLWSNGATTTSLTNLSAGNYDVTVTDGNGCTSTASVTLTEPAALSLSMTATDGSCDVGTGTATATVTGGTLSYSYLWSDGQTTTSATSLLTGTYAVSVSDANGCHISDSVTVGTNVPTDTCSIQPGDFRTEGQGGWGSTCQGNNAGCYRDNNFAAAFPNGLTVGCNFTLTLTTSQAVENYLPCTSVPGTLTQNYVNPPCFNTVLGGQLVTAMLNVTFDQYDTGFSNSPTNLINLVYTSGPFAGWSVGDVIAEANRALGGCGSTYSFSDLNIALTQFNENFLSGSQSNGNLDCPDPCPSSRPALAPRQVNGAIAWPNPFHGLVNIEFNVKTGGEGWLEIISTTGGRSVGSQYLGNLQPGIHCFSWDGTDHKSNIASDGLYLVVIRVKDQIEVVKVMRR